MRRAARVYPLDVLLLRGMGKRMTPTLPYHLRQGHAAALLQPPIIVDEPRAPVLDSLRYTRQHQESQQKIKEEQKGVSPTLSGIPESTDRLAELLQDRRVDLNGLLPTLLDMPLEAISRQQISAALKKRNDPSSLLRFTPYLLQFADTLPLRSTSFLLCDIIRQYGNHRMIAGVPYLVDYFLERSSREWTSVRSPAEVQELIWMWYRLIRSFWRFSSDNLLSPIRRTPLPQPIQDQVYRLVQNLISHLDDLPSSSTQNAHFLPAQMRTMLLGKRYVSAPLRDLVISHVQSRGLEMSIQEWHLCLLSAMRDGDARLVDVFLAKKAVAMDVVSAAELDTANGEDSEGMIKVEFDTDETSISELPIPRRSPDKILHSIITAVAAPSASGSATILEPFLGHQENLAPPEPSTLHSFSSNISESHLTNAAAPPRSTAAYAWSTLFHKINRETSTPVEDLKALYHSMSPDLFIKETITPVLKGLAHRGDTSTAWDLWLDLVALEHGASNEEKGKWIDRIVLSVATEICFAVHGLDQAVELVDTWARRASGPADSTRTIILDAQNVNALLRLCQLAGSPSVALRLWMAAYPRWGVKLDDVSLNLLLDVARFAPLEDESVASRLRALASSFLHSKERVDTTNYENYDSQGFASGSAGVLLDSPKHRSGRNGNAAAWKRAKQVFEDVIYGNWPHLETTRSPLDMPRTALGTSYHWTPPTPSPSSSALPAPHAKYTHIIPTAGSFHSYIGLLAFSNSAQDIPRAFAWAKEVNVIPHWETMRSGLMSIGEIEGPRRRIRGWGEKGETKLVRDEEIMRRWLRTWLDGDPAVEQGEASRVPSEQDVADLRRKISEDQRGTPA